MNPHTDTGEKCHHTISGSYHDCGGSTYTAAVSDFAHCIAEYSEN